MIPLCCHGPEASQEPPVCERFSMFIPGNNHQELCKKCLCWHCLRNVELKQCLDNMELWGLGFFFFV